MTTVKTICSKCKHEGWCCQECGKCTFCGAGVSILAPHLCWVCACDPALPNLDQMQWWQHSYIDNATFDVLEDARGRSLQDAWNNAKDWTHDKIYNKLRDLEEKHIEEDIEETIRRLQEHYEFSDDTLNDALAASDPLERLKSLLLPDDEEEDSEEHSDRGLIDDESDIDEWVSGEIDSNMEFLFEDLASNCESDMDVASYLNLTDTPNSFYSAISERLGEQHRYEKTTDYRNMAIALQIAPFEIETYYGDFKVDDFLGLCPSCMAPLTNYDIGKENVEGVCRHCSQEINLRTAYLTWAYINGELCATPDVFLAPENQWILWPAEMRAKYKKSQVIFKM